MSATTGATDVKTISVDCPICWQTMTLAVEWETEHGEFGTVLSHYPVISADPDEAVVTQGCSCVMSNPLMELLADHLNDGRIEDYLYPEQARSDDSDADYLSPATAEAVRRLLAVYKAAEEALRHVNPDIFDEGVQAFEVTAWALQTLNDKCASVMDAHDDRRIDALLGATL